MIDAGHERDPFSRSRHLFFALVASAAFIGLDVWLGDGFFAALAQLGASGHRTLQSSTLAVTLRLLVVAAPAWLAMTVCDTRSRVTFLPLHWRTIGLGAPAIVMLMLVYLLGIAANLDPNELGEWADKEYRLFITPTGIHWGWFLLRTAIGVLAEELLFRVLLQRAFEGFMKQEQALVVQGLLFQLAHAYLYDYGFYLYQGIGGIAYGLAFMRTRSLAAPFLLHMAHNLGHFAIVAASVALAV